MSSLAALRTEAHTPEFLNQRIRQRTTASIARALAGGHVAIDERLRELDREWDVERALETLASVNILLGLALATRSSRWLIFSAVVSGFLVQHALHGWCPPLPALRALGFRTRREIDSERCALKAARGDFHALGMVSAAGPNTLLALAEI